MSFKRTHLKRITSCNHGSHSTSIQRISLNKDYVIDMLVEEEIILELKAVEGILPVHEAQLISYLKLAHKRLGFLINFNVPLLKNGFKRFVNNF